VPPGGQHRRDHAITGDGAMSEPSTSLSLAGLNALVIGGSSGIGEAIAHGCAAAGARVAIAARSPEKLKEATARLAAAHPGSQGYVADVTDGAELARLADTVTRDFGPIDILVPCQGTTIIKPTLDFTPEEPMPHETPLIATIVAGLVLAFIFGALANRFRIPPLVGYLLAGVLVGPHTPGFVADQHLALELARSASSC
jgi:hypothetical protein